MKKLLGILVLGLLWCNAGYTENFKCFSKTGFVTKNYKFKEDIKLKDPENTIIFIFHHGGKGDSAAKNNDCALTKDYIKNVFKLSKENFGAKKNLVYIVNTKPFYGDAYKDRKNKSKWKAFPAGKYPGKTKTEKKIDYTNEIIDNFTKRGIKPNNIIISGHSCGGWLTLMYVARYPEKVRGGIAYHPACFDRLTEFEIWTADGKWDYFEDHNWKCPTKDKYDGEYACARAYFNLRMTNITEIRNAKDLKVAVVHNEDDPYEGKTSKWLKNIKSIELIETPTKEDNYKINGKSCIAKDSKKNKSIGHDVFSSSCMPEFFPRIVKYFK